VDAIDDLVAELPDEIVDYIGDLQDSVETLTKSLEEAKAVDDPVVVDDRDPIEKALDTLDDDAAAVITEKLEQLDVLESKVTKAEEDAADAEFIAKARSFDGLGDPDEIGPALRRLASSAPEDAAVFEKAFAAAAEQLATGDIYTELGHEVHKSTDIDEQVAEIAKSYQTANPELSGEEARSMAWENNPELYEEHRLEQRSRQRL